MSLVDTLKRAFTAEERIVYRCETCGETFETGTDDDAPACPACGDDDVEQINRV